jgi:peptide subunit release factor 1 (eRF1)
MTSLALDVDGRDRPRQEHWDLRLRALLREAEHVAAASGDPAIVASVAGDVARIRQRADQGFDRTTTRGVVAYACSAEDRFTVYEFPVAVRDQVRVGSRPFLLPLEAARESCVRFVAVLADRRRARVFELTGDTLTEVEDLFEWVPPRVESGGWAQARGQRHSDALARRHLEHAAMAVRRLLLDGEPAQGLLIGGPERARHELERLLEPETRAHPRTASPAGAGCRGASGRAVARSAGWRPP